RGSARRDRQRRRGDHHEPPGPAERLLPGHGVRPGGGPGRGGDRRRGRLRRADRGGRRLLRRRRREEHGRPGRGPRERCRPVPRRPHPPPAAQSAGHQRPPVEHAQAHDRSHRRAGAGLSLALACDLRYAASGAVLTTAFAKVAFAGDYGGTWFLTQLVGSSKAKELYYFCERLSAEEAERLAIVNAVFPPVDFEREVMERARRLAQGPSIAYRYMKENLNRAVAGELGECMDLEVTHHAHTGLTEDHREAAQAFVDKREPRFRGR